MNKLKITVKAGLIESNQADALNLTARPVINSISTKRKELFLKLVLQFQQRNQVRKYVLMEKGLKHLDQQILKFKL